MTTTIVNPSSLGSTKLLINPAFSVIQKAASGVIANSLALPTQSLGYLGGTNWFEAASGGTPAYAYDSAAQSFTLTGASGVTFAALGQRIESKDTNALRNKTVTLSVELSNSLLTRVDWTIQRPTTTNDIHGTIGTPTQTVIASGFWTVSSTLTRYQATFALPDLVSRGLEIRFSVFAQTSGTWIVARPQLEEGNIATNFSCDDHTSELLRCRRYYKVSSWRDTHNAAAANDFFSINFPSNDMFAEPIKSSIELENVNAQNAQWSLLGQFEYRAIAAGLIIYSANAIQSAHIP